MRETLRLLCEACRLHPSWDNIQLRNQFRRQYLKAIKSSKIRAYDEFIGKSGNKPRAMWHVLNSIEGVGRRKKNDPGSSHTADEFNSYFSGIAESLLTELDAGAVDPLSFMNSMQRGVHSFSFTKVSYNRVRDIISSLKNSFSKDAYGMTVELLKSIKDVIIVPLTKLINLCIDANIFPDTLKLALVRPIQKKYTSCELENFRPISILPVFSKVYETVLKDQMVDYFESGGLFHSSQFGYRRGLDATRAIVSLTRIITEAFDRGESCGLALLDLSRAFDCVAHSVLIKKLQFYNFDDGALNLMRSYLTDRKQFVCSGAGRSETRGITHGVPQGSILGPILFIIYMNDFAASLPDSDVLLYADDTALIHASKSPEVINAVGERAKLDAEQWLAANKLTMNRAKTQNLLFTLRRNVYTPVDSTVKYLGVTFDTTLRWHTQGERLCARLSSSIYLLNVLSNSVSLAMLKTVYFSSFHSHMAYGILAWGHASCRHNIFRLQRRAVRVVAGLSYREDCRQAFRDLGVLTCPSVFVLECLLYAHRIQGSFIAQSEIHSHSTRRGREFRADFHRLTKTKDGPGYAALKLFNCLPVNIQQLPFNSFKSRLKSYLLAKAFYATDDFYSARDVGCEV